jgi:hypothetical protein
MPVGIRLIDTTRSGLDLHACTDALTRPDRNGEALP